MAAFRPAAGTRRVPGRGGPALLASFCLLLLAAPALAGEAGRVLEVVDGDTLRVRASGGGTLLVRLVGIDAPEKGHPSRNREYHSEESTRFLRSLCEGREVL